MPLNTRDEYLDGLRGLGHRLFMQGEAIKDGAGSPQAQKIMIGRLADLGAKKACALRLCGAR